MATTLSCSERAAAALLAALRGRGHAVTLAPSGAVAVAGAAALTPEDREAIRAAKLELLTLLAAEAAPPRRQTATTVRPSGRPSTADLPAYVRRLEAATLATRGPVTAARQVRAELAFLATPRRGLEVAGGPVMPEPEPPAELPEDLRRWPAAPRYAVAACELAGATRADAVAAVREGWRP